jgi:hypothetical protein
LLKKQVIGDNLPMKIEAGDTVIAVLHSPREKLLGILNDLSPAGITIRSIELGYFDDWCQSIVAGEAHLQMSDNFFPMWRVERISRDESSDGMPSMAEQFETRTGLRLEHQ